MRWIGYRLNTIVQTGSNFGEGAKHDNPFLCDIGSGTMVSDGLKMINAAMSNTAFKLSTVRIGDHIYLGNYIRYPAGSKIGANCLLATKVMVPIEGPVRENVGLLGSPCFEIPRAVNRDREMSKMDDDTRQQRLREKNRHNLVTAVAFLLSNWFLSFTVTLAGLVALLFFPRYGMVSIFSSAAFAFFFAILWLWLVERAGLGFGRLTPKVVPVLDGYYWYHERHWKLCGLGPWFAGTPFKNVISRLQGIRLGKKVFDDGASCTECSLIEIGDYTNVNVGCVIQPHSLEEGVFKSDYIKIGAGCTLGCASLVHYGVTMGDHVVLEPDSFLMKGEIVDPNTTWRGNPARAVGEPAVRGAAIERETPEIFVPAKAA